MRFIATADLHIGTEIPGLDRFDTLKQIGFATSVRHADFLFIVGDIYDHLLVSNILRVRFNNFIKEISEYCRVIILTGNHDVGRLTTSLAPIEPFIGTNIKVVSKATKTTIDGKRFLFLPYEKRFDSEPKALLEEVKKFKGTYDFVLGHFGVSQAEVGCSNFRLMAGIRKEVLDKYLHTDYFILGHIHKPQRIGDNLYYCGSPDYLDFGERDEQKRYLHYDSNKDIIRSVPLTNLPLIQQDIFPDMEDFDIQPTGIYKLVIHCHKDEVNKINLRDVVEKIKAGNGRVIRVVWKIKSEPRKRAEFINFRKSLKRNIKKYIQTFGKSKMQPAILEGIKEVWNEVALG